MSNRLSYIVLVFAASANFGAIAYVYMEQKENGRESTRLDLNEKSDLFAALDKRLRK